MDEGKHQTKLHLLPAQQGQWAIVNIAEALLAQLARADTGSFQQPLSSVLSNFLQWKGRLWGLLMGEHSS